MNDKKQVEHADALAAAPTPAFDEAAELAEIRAAAEKYSRSANTHLLPPGFNAEQDKFVEGWLACAKRKAGGARCAVPPIGWECTRNAGHEGPCAAVESEDSK